MALRGTDPESYITEYDLVYEDDVITPLADRTLGRSGFSKQSFLQPRVECEITILHPVSRRETVMTTNTADLHAPPRRLRREGYNLIIEMILVDRPCPATRAFSVLDNPS